MRCVFVGTGGFLGRVDGDTRCAFWAEEPVDHDFDPKRLITVDLARTPSAAAAHEIGWDAVQVDDCFTGPNGNVCGTTLGPRWPELRLTGAVYLERLPGHAAGCAPPGVPAGRNDRARMRVHDDRLLAVRDRPSRRKALRRALRRGP